MDLAVGVAQLLDEKSILRLRIDMSWSLHCEEDPNYAFPEMKLLGLVPNFNIHVSVSYLYVYSRNRSQIHKCRNSEQGLAVSIPGIHKSDLLCSACSMQFYSRT